MKRLQSKKKKCSFHQSIKDFSSRRRKRDILYYDWGNELYKKQNFRDAFEVFADGYYRYPENKDFLNNTFVTFYNSLNINWQNKNWAQSKGLIEEMIDLQVLKDKDRNHISGLLFNWSGYFNSVSDQKSKNEVQELMARIKND